MKIQNFVFTTLAFMLFFWILAIGREVFVPLTIAVMIWYLSYSISSFYTLIWPKKYLNSWVSFGLTILGVVSVIGLIVALVWSLSSTFSAIVVDIPALSAKMNEFLNSLVLKLNLQEIVDPERIKSLVKVEDVLKSLTVNLTSVVSAFLLILVFALFLIMEQGSFDKKLMKLFRTKINQEKAKKLIRKIDNKIKRYFLLKTAISAATALVSYAVMDYVGLQFAAFFAVLIFLLNFIPTLGSIVSTTIPAAFALTQFGDINSVLIVILGIGAAEVVIGNILEPKIVGNSLNLSPLVIILSLIVWGKVWGLAGMFLCVPIMVSINLFLSEFDETKKISVLLSRDGDLDN